MGANQQSRESVRFFKLIGKAEKADQVNNRVICEVVKNGDKYEAGEWFSSLSGRITHMEVKEFEYDGEKKKKFVIQMADGAEKMQLEFSPSYATYGLINSLLGADLNMNLEISGWIGKTGFVGTGVSYVGERESLKWVIPIDGQPKAVEFKKPSGKVEKDHTNVQDFWIEKFLEVATKLKTGVVDHNYTTAQSQAASMTQEPFDDDIDHLPF